MSQFSQIQQHPEEPELVGQLADSKTVAAKPQQLVSTTEAVTPTLLPSSDLALLLQYGGITSAIILSLALFVLALAEFTKVLVPVMLKSDTNDTPEVRHDKAEVYSHNRRR